MTDVILYGELGKVVGQKWRLQVKTPREALRAIEANTKKLFKYLYKEENQKSMYRVVIDGEDFHHVMELTRSVKKFKTLEFIPVLTGAGSGGTMLIIGAALLLIAATIITFGALAPADAGLTVSAGSFLGETGVLGFSGFVTGGSFAASVAGLALTLGITFILSGITQLLSPQPPPNTPNYSFGGALNTTQQGAPVPLGYGQLIIGSVVISAGVSSISIPVSSTQPPTPTGII